MTFEARDSAAKVVPARYKPSTAPSSARSTPRPVTSSTRRCERRAASCQTRQSFNSHCPPKVADGMTRSPSAPSLVDSKSRPARSSQNSELSLLSPHLLPRQAVSMDCSHVDPLSNDTSQQSKMTMDLHQWRCALSVEDETRDKKKKKRLPRQKTVDYHDQSEHHKQRSTNGMALRRCASTSTQTRMKTKSHDPSTSCCMHQPRHRSMGASDTHIRTTLRRNRSTGHSPVSTPMCHTTSPGHISQGGSPVGPPLSCSNVLQKRQRSCSPDTTTIRRSSRASCPSPCRARSPSPSCLRGSPTRKSSLPQQNAVSQF